MKKMTLGRTLAIAMLSSTAMAAEFHALGKIQAAPVQDQELSATEGGAFCDGRTSITVTNDGFVSSGGGVALCAKVWVWGAQDNVSKHGHAEFLVANEGPITAAQFIQVVN